MISVLVAARHLGINQQRSEFTEVHGVAHDIFY